MRGAFFSALRKGVLTNEKYLNCSMGHSLWYWCRWCTPLAWQKKWLWWTTKTWVDWKMMGKAKNIMPENARIRRYFIHWFFTMAKVVYFSGNCLLKKIKVIKFSCSFFEKIVFLIVRGRLVSVRCQYDIESVWMVFFSRLQF